MVAAMNPIRYFAKMTSLWALALLAVVGLTGSPATAIRITVGDKNITNGTYFVKGGDAVILTCSGGSSLTWLVLSTVAVSSVNMGNGLYQSSSSEGVQLLHVESFQRALAATYSCKAANSSEGFVELKEDILDNVVVLNSTAVMLQWSTMPSTGLVHCCSDGVECLVGNAGTSLSSFVFSGLEEYTNYTVSVVGESREVCITTYQDRPSGGPQSIGVFIESALLVTISWRLPIEGERNGIVISYEVNCIVSGPVESSTTESVIVENATFDSPSQQSYQISAMHHSTYSCWISAATVNGSGPASAPINFTVELPEVVVSKNGDASVIVRWEVPHVVTGASSMQSTANLVFHVVGNGEVKTKISVPVNLTDWTISNLDTGVPYAVTVEVGVSNIITASEPRIFFTRELEPREAVAGLSAAAINATAIRVNWTELSLNVARGFPYYTIHLQAGLWSREIRVKSPPAIVTGLLPDTRYRVQVNVETVAGTGTRANGAVFTSTESEIPEISETAAPLIAPVAVGVGVGTIIAVLIAACVFLAILTFVCILRWRSTRKKYSGFEATEGQVVYITGHGTPMNSPPANRESVLFSERFAQQLEVMNPLEGRESYENTQPPVKVSEFSEYCHRMREDNRFGVEFESVPKFDTSAPMSEALAKANKPKNRYLAIVPYDQSRVILSGQNNYINASFVTGYKRTKMYIATQGPLEGTVSDFWQMVWEQRCSVIAMLTNLAEAGTAKCHKYWEDQPNKPLHLPNGISVCQDQHKFFAEYEYRIFTVTHKDSEQPALVVHHFQYTAWPDYHVPKYPASLVRFVQSVRHAYKDEDTPMVVHCSAGVGRTGTFIAIDAMMQRMKERDEISIYEYLHEMRNCRMCLVMNVEQYEFIHDALCGFAMSGNTYINATEFDQELARLKEISEDGGYTAVEKQFQLLEQLSRKPVKEDHVFAEEHVEDNRYETRYPYASNHVAISRTGQNDKYINAAAIDSYSKQHAFIAAEAPSLDKVELVLEVIAQKQCCTVVVLCTEEEMKEVSFCKFWPVEESASVSFGQYSLHLTNKLSKDVFTELKITLMRTEGPEHHFTLIYINGWSENNEPEPQAVWGAIQEYERVQRGITAPALVMCSDGMGRTGAFICMCSEVERIRMEGMADVFQSVKAARYQRPYMVSTVEQYVLIHEVLMCFLKTFQIYDNFGCAVNNR